LLIKANFKERALIVVNNKCKSLHIDEKVKRGFSVFHTN
jgi:hypothetical protein